MKKFVAVVAIILVVVIAFWIVLPPLFTQHGNGTFVSYAPGGRNMAYVTPDDTTGVKLASTDRTDFANGDRVKIKMGNDGIYAITGGPY